MQRITFFSRQAWANLGHNRQRTLFVLFCIAVGVAAVVSLRTLGLMIGSSLTRNLQADSQGDIVVTVPVDTIAAGGEYDPTLVEAIDDVFAVDSFSAEGIERMRAWSSGRGYEVTVATRSFSPIRVRPDLSTGRSAGQRSDALAHSPAPREQSGPLFAEGGTEIDAKSKAALVFFIEPDRYPLYGETEFVEPRDITLAQALTEPHHIVIAAPLADALDVAVGDPVRLVGSESYLVTAIVDQGTEATLWDPMTVFAPYVYLRYDVGVEMFDAMADTVYLGLPPGSDVQAIGEDFKTAFMGMNISTTQDLREQNSALSQDLTKLITMMGMVSLLIGGIGIINTMLVVVGRRTREIAVLKTIGLQGRQITLMFLLEALLFGLLGSSAGILLGLALVALLQRLAERASAQTLQFAVYPQAMIMGLVTGVLVTLVFALLPTLSAGRVRPNTLLNPSATVLPKAGRRLSLLVVVLLTGIMGLLAGQILENSALGVGIAYGTVVLLGIAILIFRGLLFVLCRLPSFGSISLKLSQRAVRGQLGRTASTLLALVVGMFALSIVLLFTSSLVNVINEFLTNQLGGNVLVGAKTREADLDVQALLGELDGVRSVTHEVVYPAAIVAINGNRDMDAILEEAHMRAEEAAGRTGNEELEAPRVEQNSYKLLMRRYVDSFDMRLASKTNKEYELVRGKELTPDSDKNIALQVSHETEWLGLDVGDTLTLLYDGQDEHNVTISGLISRPSGEVVVVNLGDETPALGSDNVIPDGLEPRPSAYVVDVEEEKVNAVLGVLSDLPDVVTLEASQLNELLERMFQQLSVLPLIVAALALFSGGVIMANTVSLATLERRRQIGIMKAIGLQSRDVLRLLMVENGLIGLAGGMIGAGTGALTVVLLGVVADNPGSFPVWTLVALILLAVAIALGATLVTAYGATREKPLVVLRGE